MYTINQILFYSKLYGLNPNIFEVKKHQLKTHKPLITNIKEFYLYYPDFNWRYYQYINPGINKLFTGEFGMMQHWVRFGQANGYKGNPNKIVTDIDCFNNRKNFSQKELVKIYKNIDQFSNLIKGYKNILFISGDYPGYGGAATNCHQLAYFYKNKGHSINEFYFKFGNYAIDHIIVKNHNIFDNAIELKKAIKQLETKPDLVILKSFVGFNIKTIINTTVFYLVGGIYNNSLNQHYSSLKINLITINI